MSLPLPDPFIEDQSIRRNFEALADEFPVRPRAATFTVATLPAASALSPGTIVYVSDGAAGAKARMSTGAAYINLG